MNPTRNPVGWFEIYVQDMERAKQFYEATFAVTLELLPSPNDMPLEMWSFPMGTPDLPGAAGALVKMEGCSSGGSGTIVYFSCEDCAVEAARAVANGGSMQQDKFSIGEYGFIALVFDSEGNIIGLHSMQ
jgi:predicted enzyme related to lactoylglutathione lyase